MSSRTFAGMALMTVATLGASAATGERVVPRRMRIVVRRLSTFARSGRRAAVCVERADDVRFENVAIAFDPAFAGSHSKPYSVWTSAWKSDKVNCTNSLPMVAAAENGKYEMHVTVKNGATLRINKDFSHNPERPRDEQEQCLTSPYKKLFITAEGPGCSAYPGAVRFEVLPATNNQRIWYELTGDTVFKFPGINGNRIFVLSSTGGTDEGNNIFIMNGHELTFSRYGVSASQHVTITDELRLCAVDLAADKYIDAYRDTAKSGDNLNFAPGCLITADTTEGLAPGQIILRTKKDETALVRPKTDTALKDAGVKAVWDTYDFGGDDGVLDVLTFAEHIKGLFLLVK